MTLNFSFLLPELFRPLSLRLHCFLSACEAHFHQSGDRERADTANLTWSRLWHPSTVCFNLSYVKDSRGSRTHKKRCCCVWSRGSKNVILSQTLCRLNCNLQMSYLSLMDISNVTFFESRYLWYPCVLTPKLVKVHRAMTLTLSYQHLSPDITQLKSYSIESMLPISDSDSDIANLQHGWKSFENVSFLISTNRTLWLSDSIQKSDAAWGIVSACQRYFLQLLNK